MIEGNSNLFKIFLKEYPSNNIHKKYIYPNDIPIFFNNQKIEGNINYKDEEKNKIKFKNIIIKLIYIVQIGNNNHLTHIVHSINVNSLNSTFSFENIQFPYQSYYGHNISLLYYIQVIVTRQLRTDIEILFPFHLFFINFLKNNYLKEFEYTYIDQIKEISLFSNFNSNQLSPFDDFYGKFTLILQQENIIKNINLKIYVIESFDSIKNFNKILCKYQIIDSPLIGTIQIPILIQLLPLKLYPYNNLINNLIKVKYLFHFEIDDQKTNDKEIEIVLFDGIRPCKYFNK